MPREERKRKLRKQPIQLQGNTQRREHVARPSKETPKSSARPSKAKCENLTLSNWMTVYAYVDTLPPPINQGQVVNHFATKPKGALLFTQSTLSRKLQQRAEMEARVDSNPNALSSKRPCVVTSPTVEHALKVWVQQIELKGETVNGGMLIAKRKYFEETMGIPEDERLTGRGWVAKFCKA